MEGPCAVVVPAVVDDEAARANAVNVVEVALPVVEHVEHLVGVHVVGRIGCVVAVDVQFIPRDVAGVGAPGHSAFAFGVGEERAALLRLVDIAVVLCAVLGNQAHNAANLPRFAGGERRVAAPKALDAHYVGGDGCAFFRRVDLHGHRRVGINLFGSFLNENADLERAGVRCGEDKRVVAVVIAGEARVVVAGGHVVGIVEQVGAAEVEAVVAAGVCHGDFYLLISCECHAFLRVGEHVGIVCARCFDNAVGQACACHRGPGRSGERNGVECRGERVVVFRAGSLAHGVISHGAFKAGEDLVAHQHRAACVAHSGGGRAGGIRVHIVEQGNDVVHIYVVHAREFHFGAEVVAAVAEHGFPHDVHRCALISICVVGNECMPIVVLCTAHGRAFARECLHFYAVERHGRGGHVVARAEGHGKDFRAGEEVHGVGAGEVERVVSLYERGCQHVVVERVGVGGRCHFGFAHGFLLRGIEHGVGVGRGGGLLGNGGVGHGDGLRHVVNGDDDKLAFLRRCAHRALLQAAFAGHGLAVGVSRAVNGNGCAVGSHDGIGVGLQVGFGKLPAAAGVFGAVILPKAERYGAV